VATISRPSVDADNSSTQGLSRDPARTSDYGHDAGHRVLSVRRKGGKNAKVAVPAPALEALNLYLGTTGADLVLGQGPGMSRPLFTTATSPGRWREGGRCWPWRRLGAGGDTIPSRCR
jgi:integrase/recombinase XerD